MGPRDRLAPQAHPKAPQADQPQGLEHDASGDLRLPVFALPERDGNLADDETVARNNSCGFFDAVTDRRSDMTLANLTSDAFRRQYGNAKVSTIDKIVTWSPVQSQVLFTMRATPAGRNQGEVERQGIAQLLIQDQKILVCSYLPRNTGQF